MDRGQKLSEILGSRDPRVIHFNLLTFATDLRSFSTAVCYAIEKIVRMLLEDQRAEIIEDEDHISARIRNILYGLTYNASATFVNGNTDICVERGGFRWLAEAKINRSHQDVMDGFRQLTARYMSAGGNSEIQGALLVYNFKERTDEEMKRYRQEASVSFDKEYTNFKFETNRTDLDFWSSHIDKSSGAIVFVKHIPFSFYMNPTDKSARNSKGSIQTSRENNAGKLMLRRKLSKGPTQEDDSVVLEEE